MSEEKITIYSSNDVATLLKVQSSTLRKYCLMLEREGYTIYKNEQGIRGFFDKDVIVLKKIIATKKHPDMTLEQACGVVVSWVKQKDITDSDISVITPNTSYNDGYDEIIRQFNKLQEFNEVLLEQLKKQQQQIDHKIEDGYHEIIAAIKESKEQLKLQVTEKNEEPKKKKKWWLWT